MTQVRCPVLAEVRSHWVWVRLVAVCAVLAAAGSQTANASGLRTPLRERVLRPSELGSSTVVSSHGKIRKVSNLREELASLCIKPESVTVLRAAGFVSGYRESLVTKAPEGIAFSMVARFDSTRRASEFARDDDALCGSQFGRRLDAHGIARLKFPRRVDAVGYQVRGGADEAYYLVSFAIGPYVYLEAFLSNVGAEHMFDAAVELFYERVGEAPSDGAGGA